MTTQTQKWTCEAGPRQTKQVNDALRAIHTEGQTRTELRGIIGGEERRDSYVMLFGAIREDAQQARQEIGERFKWHVTRENYKEIIEACNEKLKELIKNRPVEDKRLTKEENHKRAMEAKAYEQERDRKMSEKAEKQAQEIERVKAEKPYLKTSEYSKKSSWALGAENIREELRRNFPATKFKVTSDSFAGGCSISIRWTDGPSEEQVRNITLFYEYGQVDGMQDMTHIKDNYYLSRVFGGAKYVSESRTITPDWIEKYKSLVAEPKDENERYEIERRACREVRELDLTGAKAIDYVDCRLIVTEREEAPVATEEPTESAPETVDGITIKLNEEKGGVEIYFPSKPSEEVRASLKSHKFRWSRRNKCWYRKQTPQAIAFAESLKIA